MCGIVGYVGEIDAQRAPALLRRMAASLAHRGPDGEGIWHDVGIGLGHRRLSIIDIEGGAQPMQACERYRIVFNGEIYNHKALRAELQAAGYVFRTRADTEVIAPALEHWGRTEGLRRLRGMFAFALYDSSERTLLLARDRFGIKPLYVARGRNVALFASEPKAVLLVPEVERRVDPVALLDFFVLGQALSPRTCFRSIQEIEPGTWLEIRTDGERSERWFDWSRASTRRWRKAAAVDALEETLTDSLRVHLESDVPIVAFLSGGIDSSVLVGLLRKHLVQELDTYNVGFDEAGYDESWAARAVATRWGTRHEQLSVRGGEGRLELFQRVVEQYDQPYGDSSCVPTWMVCREMSRRAKVAISGDGGDEMLAGYGRFQTARWLARLGGVPVLPELIRSAAHAAARLSPDLARRLRKVSAFSRLGRAELLCALLTYFSADEARALLRPEHHAAAISEGSTAERFVRYVPETRGDAAAQLMSAELQSVLHADTLRKVDVASSAHGLEVRTPFLDPEVLALVATFPISLQIRRGRGKDLLRTLAGTLLPREVVRRKKQGFGIPLDRWMGRELQGWLRELLGPSARSAEWLEPAAIRRVLDGFSGERNPEELSRYQAYQRLFMLASFELWLRKWAPAS